jgi:hypothetical protein
MEILLLAVTIASLAMALAMGVLVFRLLRDERRRSDARVAALLEVAGDGAAPSPSVAADLELRHDAPVEAAGDLFAVPERSSPWGARAAVAAAFAVVVGGVGYALLARTDVSPVAAAIRPALTAAPLELVALRHTANAGALTISGVVHNPRGAVTRSGVLAAAFAFDAKGGEMASAQAPVDFLTLAPGDESPFVLTIPTSGSVARYRVGFRSGDGAVIAHIDKRPRDEAVARR